MADEGLCKGQAVSCPLTSHHRPGSMARRRQLPSRQALANSEGLPAFHVACTAPSWGPARAGWTGPAGWAEQTLTAWPALGWRSLKIRSVLVFPPLRHFINSHFLHDRTEDQVCRRPPPPPPAPVWPERPAPALRPLTLASSLLVSTLPGIVRPEGRLAAWTCTSAPRSPLTVPGLCPARPSSSPASSPVTVTTTDWTVAPKPTAWSRNARQAVCGRGAPSPSPLPPRGLTGASGRAHTEASPPARSSSPRGCRALTPLVWGDAARRPWLRSKGPPHATLSLLAMLISLRTPPPRVCVCSPDRPVRPPEKRVLERPNEAGVPGAWTEGDTARARAGRRAAPSTRLLRRAGSQRTDSTLPLRLHVRPPSAT